MILDTISNPNKYREPGQAFVRAYAFLSNPTTPTLRPGMYNVWGNRVRAIISMDAGRKATRAPLEVHRAHLDIHYLIDGTETLGWRPLSTCAQPLARFNPTRDIQFFDDKPDHWVTTKPGQFVIFYPSDCHAPGVGTGTIHKVVIKIRM